MKQTEPLTKTFRLDKGDPKRLEDNLMLVVQNGTAWKAKREGYVEQWTKMARDEDETI